MKNNLSITQPYQDKFIDESSTSKPLPPTISGAALLGALPSLVKDPFGFVVQARESYGDVYTLNLGLLKTTMLNHPNHAQHVLIDNVANYPKKGALWESLRTFLGNGLVVSEGDFWLRQRRMIQPQFHHKQVEGLATLMSAAIEESIAGWDEIADTGQPFDISHACTQITMKVIVKTLFGDDLSTAEADQLGDAIGIVLDYTMKGMLAQSLPSWVPIPGSQRYQQAIQETDAFIGRVIQHRNAEPAGAPRCDLLGMLLAAVDSESGERMTPKQLRDELVTFFLAGHETTAGALGWAFHFLSREEEVAHTLQRELDEVLAQRPPAFADLRSLPYARMVMQEALRLYSPAYWIPRTALADDEIDGFHIPAGSTVAILMHTIHRHPEFWPDPERFEPLRFEPANPENHKRHRLAWMPFGAGQRQCIGKEFSLMEGQLVLAEVMQRYRLKPVLGHTPRPQLSTTLRAKGGVWVRLERR